MDVLFIILFVLFMIFYGIIRNYSSFSFLTNVIYLTVKCNKLKKKIRNTITKLDLNVLDEKDLGTFFWENKLFEVNAEKNNIFIHFKIDYNLKLEENRFILKFDFKSKENVDYLINYCETIDGSSDNEDGIIYSAITGDKNFDKLYRFSFVKTIFIPSLFDYKLRSRLVDVAIYFRTITIKNHSLEAVAYPGVLENEVDILKCTEEIIAVIKKLGTLKRSFVTISKNIHIEQDFDAELRMIESLHEFPDEIKEIEKLCENRGKKYEYLYHKNRNEENFNKYTAYEIACQKARGRSGFAKLAKLLSDNISEKNKINILIYIKDNCFEDFKNDFIKLYKNTESYEISKQILAAFIQKSFTGLIQYVSDELAEGRVYTKLQIEYLGLCGEKKHVETLYNLSRETKKSDVSQSCNDAIAKIQSRLGDVEKGWVSVEETTDLDGALSRDDLDKKGRLSKEES